MLNGGFIMPDDSCRKCGGTLVKYSLCAGCMRAIQQICLECGSKSEEMSHQCHLNLQIHQTRNSMMENTYSISAWQNPSWASFRPKFIPECIWYYPYWIFCN